MKLSFLFGMPAILVRAQLILPTANENEEKVDPLLIKDPSPYKAEELFTCPVIKCDTTMGEYTCF